MYDIYAYRIVSTANSINKDQIEDIEVLYIAKYLHLPNPMHLPGMFVQLFISLGGIIFLSHLFSWNI